MSDTAAISKSFATMRARAALAGVELRTLEDDRGELAYVCTRVKNASTCTFETLSGVHAWLDLIGAPA